MLKTEVSELPKRIISNGLQSAKLDEWSRLYKNMVDAYKRLPFHCGEEAIPINPKEITESRFKSYVERMMRSLNEDQQLVWKKLLSDAQMNIKFVRNFFDVFPMAEFDVDSNQAPLRKSVSNARTKLRLSMPFLKLMCRTIAVNTMERLLPWPKS